MLHFITGFQGSGKSLLAERMLADLTGRVTYVGTLPDHPAYESIIYEHKNRRPGTWNLLELSGNSEVDMAALSAVIDHSDAILIDGILFYLLRMLAFGFDLSSLSRLTFSMLDNIRRSACLVIVVDSLVPVDLPPATRRILRYAHAILLRSATTVTFVKSGIGVPVSGRLILQLEKQAHDGPRDWRIKALSNEEKWRV